jgi:hypothetical protein
VVDGERPGSVKRRIFLRTLSIASHEEPLSDRMTSYDLSAPASVHLSVTCVPLTEAETTGATMDGAAEFAAGKLSTKATVATCKTVNTSFRIKSSLPPRSRIPYASSGSSPPSSALTETLFTPQTAQRFAHKSLGRRYTFGGRNGLQGVNRSVSQEHRSEGLRQDPSLEPAHELRIRAPRQHLCNRDEQQPSVHLCNRHE